MVIQASQRHRAGATAACLSATCLLYLSTAHTTVVLDRARFGVGLPNSKKVMISMMIRIREVDGGLALHIAVDSGNVLEQPSLDVGGFPDLRSSNATVDIVFHSLVPMMLVTACSHDTKCDVQLFDLRIVNSHKKYISAADRGDCANPFPQATRPKVAPSELASSMCEGRTGTRL